MRKSILSGNYDEQLVPCVMRRLHDPTGYSMEFIGRPKSDPFQSGRINLVMGGYVWDYFMEADIDRKLTLQKHGKLVIQILDVKDFSALS